MRPAITGVPAKEKGFTIMELMIAMSITLGVMVMASTLLSISFNTRARENQRSDALADAQRALNSMTREIANSGCGLIDNGIIALDSNVSSIRVRSNLNAFMRETTSNLANDRDEDIKYLLHTDGSDKYIVRIDVNTGTTTTVLANRADSLQLRYYAEKVNYTAVTCETPTTPGSVTTPGVAEVAQKKDAKYIVGVICINLPKRGTPGTAGFQPASQVQLVSDIALRNADLRKY